MARFSIDGLDDLLLSIEEIAAIPNSVKADMLNAGAEVIADGQKAVGRQMGVHRTGVTLESIKPGKAVPTNDGGHVDVYPQGTNADGNRNAEVGFINEYGKRGQPARPFINTANERYADKAVEKEAEVYDEFLKSKGV